MSVSPVTPIRTGWKWRVKVTAILLAMLMAFTLAVSTDTRAQQRSDPILIGRVALGNPSNSALLAFEKRLGELGYVDGQNIRIEFPSTGGKAELLAGIAADLVAMPVDIIVATGPEAVLKAASAATDTIPIVTMAVNYNPVAKGYVRSLADTGTNVTGAYFMQVTLSAKRLALLKEAIPHLKAVAAVWDVHTLDQFQATQKAAHELGLELHSVELTDPPYDFDRAIGKAREQGGQALVVLSSPLFLRQREMLVAAAAAYRLPAIYIFPNYSQAGGLMAYGPKITTMYAAGAAYVDKIIKGARPTDLPMEQPTEFDLVINLKAAEELGLTLPQSILLQSTELIE